MTEGNDPSAKENRQHERSALGYDATMQTPSGARFDITIRDYSSGGLFASMRGGQPITSDPAAWELQEDDVVLTRVPLEPGRPPKIVPARISRIEQTGFGLIFKTNQEALVAKLQELGAPGGPPEISKSAPEPEPSSAAPSAAAPAKIRIQLQNTSAEYLGAHMAEFVNAAKDMFLLKASEAGSNKEQGRYFEAMGLLRQNSEQMQEDFIGRVKQHLTTFETLEFATEAGQAKGELSLVDEEEFEDWLALSELKNHYEQIHRPTLRALETRLSHALSKQLDDRNQPCSPLALSQHFYESIKLIGFQSLVRRGLLELFGEQVLQPLNDLYEELNQQLIGKGILPKLPKEPAKAATPQRQLDAAGGATDASEEQAAGDSISAADLSPEALAALQQVIEQNQVPSPAQLKTHGPDAGVGDKVIDLQAIISQLDPQPEPAAGPMHQVSMQDLNGALDELRDLRQGESRQSLTDTLSQVLKNQSADGSAPDFSEPQSEAVYLTEQLMRSIGDDTLAAPQAKKWADQLELPLLQMLLHDQAALQDQNHPARQFLNQLELAAGEIGSSGRDLQINEQIEQVIGQISNDSEVDQQTFASASGQLEQLLRRRKRLRNTQLKRLIEACEGQYKLERARNNVSDYLNQSLAGQPVPTVLLDVLDQGYRHLLELAQLRDDPKREEWEQRVDLLNQLRSRVGQDHEPSNQDADESQALLQQLEQALGQAGVDPSGREQLTKRLSDVLPGVRSEDAPEPKRVPFPSQPVAEAPAELSELDPDHAMWLGRAQMLDIGSWLLYPGEDGKTRPIKLAWVSDDRQRFVFVDRDGQKALQIGPEGLAEKLKTSQADVVDQTDAPLVDRTWQAMVQRMHEQIAHQATHDQLTDVLNRKEFERQLRLKIGEAKLMHSLHGAYQLDLDQFNLFNATVGHEAGDQVLRDVATLLREILPDDAEIARVTGDAFAVLIPKLEATEVMDRAEQMRADIAEHRIGWKEQQLQTTVSVGAVTIDQDTDSVSNVLAAMEGACQAAKDSGRDRVRSFESDKVEIGRRSMALQWVNAMELGLKAGRLELHAQKIAPVRDRSLPAEHYEVLSRLSDVDGNPISPADFVPAAEAHGKIHLLDQWVLKTAFEMLANSPRYSDIDRISLNISGKTFGRANFLEFVRNLFETSGVEPAKICFEITETAAVSNLAMCTDFLRQLRYLGCRFSLDDFGTGLSNFGYLKRLPVDYLKIDGSFVKEIATSTPDYGMVKTIHEIGNFLGKQTIAEYVENDEILEHLKEIGVDYAQGYGIAKPIPLTDVLGIIRP